MRTRVIYLSLVKRRTDERFGGGGGLEIEGVETDGKGSRGVGTRTKALRVHVRDERLHFNN